MSAAKSLSIVGALVTGAAAFGVSLVLMNPDQKPADDQIQPLAAHPEKKAPADNGRNPDIAPIPAENKPDAVKTIDPKPNGALAPANPLPFRPGAVYSGPWKEPSGYGLPNPRP